jgi:hypothetical protein
MGFLGEIQPVPGREEVASFGGGDESLGGIWYVGELGAAIAGREGEMDGDFLGQFLLKTRTWCLLFFCETLLEKYWWTIIIPALIIDYWHNEAIIYIYIIYTHMWQVMKNWINTVDLIIDVTWLIWWYIYGGE